MDDNATSGDTQDPQQDQAGQDGQPGTGADLAAEVEKWRALARKHEDRAKANSAAARELEQFRQQSMTETEKAAAEAEKRGRASALAEVGQRLARSEFKAAAARRNPDADVAAVLEFVDVARFVGDDGEPDTDAITAAVERLLPASSPKVPAPPSFDGGPRSTATTGDGMTSLIRRAAGRS